MGIPALATTKSRTQSTQKRRRWPWVVLGLFFIASIAWWQFGAGLRGDATAGTAYAARVACSCKYVAGRSLEDCGKDKLAGMEMIGLSADDETRSVTASVPLIASDTASYRTGYGCVLQEWEG